MMMALDQSFHLLITSTIAACLILGLSKLYNLVEGDPFCIVSMHMFITHDVYLNSLSDDDFCVVWWEIDIILRIMRLLAPVD